MKMCSSVALSFVAITLVGLCRGQDNPCILEAVQASCDVCISTSHLCSWCPYTPSNPVLKTRSRCDLAAGRTCDLTANEENPKSSINITRMEPLSSEVTVDSIQVAPQNITLNLRAQMAQKFNMTFVSLRNAPLDVYILLDLSSSLNTILQVLKNDLSDIANLLGQVSSDFQMGFGSFVDKNVRPFALHSYEENISGTVGCISFGECVPTYSFRNSQPLSSNISAIQNSISQFAKLSSNVDSPEGGLEALLQVAVCTNETGWRPRALHMVFVITDTGYHIAGDGLLAGISRPNDGQCHLKAIGQRRHEYTFGLVQDYPSVAQVRDALEQSNIVPIFATQTVTPHVAATYGKLVADLSLVGANYLVFRDNSVAEFLRIIRESYERSVQAVRVIEPVVPGYEFEIRPVADCTRSGADDPCILQFDDTVTFEVSVTLTNCTVARPMGVQLRGPPYVFTHMMLNPICSCDCSSDVQEIDSISCSNRGNLKCGKCDCGSFFGDTCECEEMVTTCPEALVDGSSLTCSGMGRCTTCGNCDCFNNTFGRACECNDRSCVDNCNGKGECLCENPPRCQCDTDPESGFRYFQQTVGDTGSCICNPNDCFNPLFPKDLCHNLLSDTSGVEFCRCAPVMGEPRASCLCPDNLAVPTNNTCAPPASFCSGMEFCARCIIGDISNSSCETGCSLSRFTELAFNEDPPPLFSHECTYESGLCMFTFSFSDSNFDGEVFYSQQCGTSTLPWIVAGSVVGVVLLLALLIPICIKLGCVILDDIEYKRFEKTARDLVNSSMENPLYTTPVTQVENPILRPSKRKI